MSVDITMKFHYSCLYLESLFRVLKETSKELVVRVAKVKSKSARTLLSETILVSNNGAESLILLFMAYNIFLINLSILDISIPFHTYNTFKA